MSKANSNNAPKVSWDRREQACGCYHQRLSVDGKETPYFIDEACFIGHRTEGKKYGLLGSGMGPVGGNRHGLRIAAVLASADRIHGLKHRAEQFALGART